MKAIKPWRFRYGPEDWPKVAADLPEGTAAVVEIGGKGRSVKQAAAEVARLMEHNMGGAPARLALRHDVEHADMTPGTLYIACLERDDLPAETAEEIWRWVV